MDRILKLRTKCRSAPNSDYTVIKKSDKEEYERQIADYRSKVKQLEQDRFLYLTKQFIKNKPYIAAKNLRYIFLNSKGKY